MISEMANFAITGELILCMSTTLAGLFAASGWVGIFAVTPFVSAVTQRLGRRPTLWLSGLVPVIAAAGFLLTDSLPLWFALEFIAGHEDLDQDEVAASDDPALSVRRKRDPGPRFPWSRVLDGAGLQRIRP